MKNLIKQYDELQTTYGSKDLNSVYGCGEIVIHELLLYL